MTAIRNYSIAVEHSADDLVKTVTTAIQNGYQPVGGVSVMNEPAKPDKGVKAPRTVFAQAMVRLYTAQDALGQVVTRVNGR